MRNILLVLILISATYLMTGIIYQEGGFGVSMVVKPSPIIEFAFGGGEEDSWARDNPQQKAPWWQGNDHIQILSGDWEGGEPYWVTSYFVGLLLAVLAWPVLALTYLIRLVRAKSRPQANAL